MIEYIDEPVATATPTELTHADMMRAVLDGKEVERVVSNGTVRVYTTDADGKGEAIADMLSYPDARFRLKTKSIVDHVVATKHGIYTMTSEESCRQFAKDHDGKVLRIELDGETLDVIHQGTRTEQLD